MKFNKKIFLTIIASIFFIFFAGCTGCDDGIKVTGVDFGEPIVELKVGDMYELDTIVSPADATNQTVLLISDGALSTNGEEVVLFQRNKKILANAPGESIITARTQDGSFTAELKIRVFANPVKLATPANLRLEGDKIVWDKVTYKVGETVVDADAYVVTINGVAHEVGGNMLQFAGYDLNINNVVTVQAISNTGEQYRVVENSNVSNELHFNKLAAPTNLSREGAVLTWDAVEGAAGYQLVVNGERQEGLITATTKTIDFDEAGYYSVSVIAIPEQNATNSMYQSDPSAPVSVMKLGKVENVRMEDYVLMYDELANSSGYIIYIKKSSKTYTIDNEVFTSINLADYRDENDEPIVAGEYEVTVVAKNNSTQGIDGLPSDPMTLVKLSGVTNTQIDKNAFAWSRVTGATSFRVVAEYTYEDEPYTIEREISAFDPRFTLPEDAPTTTYTFNIMAVAAGTSEAGIAYMSSEWKTSNLKPTKLTVPQNVTYDDTTFMFDAVTNAAGYELIIDGNIYTLDIIDTVEGRVYASTILPSKIENINDLLTGAYDVYLRANGGASHFSSDVTEAVSLTVLPKPAVIEIDKQQKVTIKMTEETMSEEVAKLWNDNNIDSLGYEVVVSQYVAGRIYEESYLYPEETIKFDNFEEGNLTIKVRKIGDGVNFISSDYAYCYTKRASDLKNVIADEKKITWSAVEDVTYAIEIDGRYEVLNTNEYEVLDTLEGNEIKFKLYNLGRDNEITSFGKEYTFTRLASPEILLVGNTVTWQAVEGAAKYRVVITYNNEVAENIVTRDETVLSYSGYNFGSLGAHQVTVSAVPESGEEIFKLASIDSKFETNKLGFTADDTFTVNNEVLSWTFNECGAEEDEIEYTLVFKNLANPSDVYTFEKVVGKSLNLYDKNMNDGIYYFTIKADYVGEKQNSFVNSSVYERRTVNVRVFPQVSNVTRNGDIVYWPLVPYALKYQLTADYGNDKIITHEIVEPRIDLSEGVFDEGEFTLTIKVLAVNDDSEQVTKVYQISSQPITLETSFNKIAEVEVLTYGVVDDNYVITITPPDIEDVNAYVNVLYHTTGDPSNMGEEAIQSGTITRALSALNGAGVYEFVIKAKDASGNKISSTAKIINVTRFGLLNNLVIENGILMWDAVENATYEVVIEAEGQTPIVNTTDVNQFDINLIVDNKDNPLPAGDYEIKARPIGNDVLFLSSVNYTVSSNSFNVLPAPENVGLNQSTKKIEWQGVLGASGYRLVFTDSEGGKVTSSVNSGATVTAAIPDTLAAGTWTVGVIAVGNGAFIVDSFESETITITKISTPSIPSHDLTKILVGRITGVENYIIKIEYGGDTPVEYEFTYTNDGFTEYPFASQGTYKVYVKAVGDYVNNIDSDYSEPLVIEKAGQLQNVKVKDNKVIFDANDFVTEESVIYYNVKFINTSDETKNVTKKVNVAEADFSGVAAGPYTIEVSLEVESNDEGFLPGGVVTVEGVYKLETPELLPKLTGISFEYAMPLDYGNAGEFVLSAYELSLNDVLINNELNTTYALGSEYGEGHYEFKVRALGDGIKLVSSDFSEVFAISKLPATTLTIERVHKDTEEISDYKLSWEAVENATAYYLNLVNVADKLSCNLGLALSINIDQLAESDYPELYTALKQYGLNKVTITAMGDGENYASGEVSNEIQFNRFMAPELKVEGGKLKWNNASDSILAYQLTIVNTTTNVMTKVSLHKVYEFALENNYASGGYSISVKGFTYDLNTNNVNINTSDSQTVTAFKLETPAQPVIKNGKFEFTTVTFDAEVASYNYEFKYGETATLFTVESKDATSYILPDSIIYSDYESNFNVFYTESPNAEVVKFRAIGDDYHLTSDWSNARVPVSNYLYGKQLDAVTGIANNESIISWTKVENASGYHVYAQGMDVTDEESGAPVMVYAVTDASCVFVNINEMFATAPAGTYTLSVIATGDAYYTDSRKSLETVTVTVLPSMTVLTESGVLVWQNLNNLVRSYSLKFYNYTTKTNYIVETSNAYFAMSDSNLPAGRYTVYLRANGAEGNILGIDYGAGVEVYKLPALEQSTTRNDNGTQVPVFIKDGKLSAVINTAFASSNSQSKPGATFLLDQVNEDSQKTFTQGIKAVFTNPSNSDDYLVMTYEATLTKSGDNLVITVNAPVGIEAGTYNVTLSLIGNSTAISPTEELIEFVSSDSTISTQMIVLPTPITSPIENGVLEWNPVSANVTEYPRMKYEVAINDRVEDTTDTMLDYNVTIDNDLKIKYGIGVAGTYTTMVAAKGNSTRYLTSAYTETVTLTVLRYPSQSTAEIVSETEPITLSDGVITWEQIENATGYDILLYGDSDGNTNVYQLTNIVPTPDMIVNGRINLEIPDEAMTTDKVVKEIYPGDYKIQICARGNGVDYITSEFSPEQSVTRLDRVEDFKNDKGIIVWKDNPNAYYYQLHIVGTDESNICDVYENVYINPASNEQLGKTNATINPTTNMVEFIFNKDQIYYPGTYEISIRAIGNDGTLISSSYNTPVRFIKLASPEVIYVQNGLITWSPVLYANNGYYLFVDGDRLDEPIMTTSTELPADYIGNPEVPFRIYVQAVGNSDGDASTRFLNGQASIEINAKKLINVDDFRIENGVLNWTRNGDANGYQLVFPETPNIVDDSRLTTVTLGRDVLKYDMASCSSGTYKNIKIKAVGDSNWLNSNFVLLEKVVKVGTPNIDFSFEENRITIKKQTYTTVASETQSYTKRIVDYEFKIINVDEGSTRYMNFNVANQIESSGDRVNVEFDFAAYGSGRLEIYVRAIPSADPDGVERALVSNYTEEPIVIEVPDSPSNLRYDRTNYVFTWDRVEGTNITYTVYYAKISKNNVASNLENNLVWGKVENIEENYFYPYELGTYTIIVRSNSSGQIFSPYIGVETNNNNDASDDIDVAIKATEEEQLRIGVRDFGVEGTHMLFAAGTGEENTPYIINTATHLNNVRYYPGRHYRLGADINLSGQTMEPIGTYGKPFTGVFDGASKEIRGYTYTNTLTTVTGLFGYTEDAQIKNIKMTSVNLVSYPDTTATGQIFIGAIAGKTVRGTISGCTVTGSVDFDVKSSSSNRSYYAGGIVGYGDRTTIYNCTSSVNVANTFCNMIKESSYAYDVTSGGIAAYTSGLTYRCINKGTIKGTSYVGGIIGYSTYTSQTSASIYECKNAGNIESVSIGSSSSSKVTYVGGIVGSNYMYGGGTYTQLIVENCYNTGNITIYGNARGTTYAGGFAGMSNSKLKYFYTTGRLINLNTSGTNHIGGIVGKTDTAKPSLVDALGNSISTVVLYHAYYKIGIGTNIAAGVNNTTSMITADDADWNNSTNAVGMNESNINSRLAVAIGSQFVLNSSNKLVLSFEE